MSDDSPAAPGNGADHADNDAGGLLDNATSVDPKAQAETPADVPHFADDEKVPPQVAKQRPDFLPEKFWDKERNEAKLDALAKSYTELEKNFKLGKHKAPEGGKYDLTPLQGKVAPDDPVVSAYTEWAGKHGLSQAAFEELAAKVVDIGATSRQQEQMSRKAEMEKLGPQAGAVIESMVDWARGFVRSGVWSEQDFNEFKIMGGSADGMRALMKLRESYEGRVPLKETLPTDDGGMSDDELDAMVGKPEYQSDPAFRAKVSRMFERRYGNGATR